MASTVKNDYLFVYGTLRKGSEIHKTLASGSTYIGEGRVNGRLYDLGEYPGILIHENGRESVQGEVYAIDGKKAHETWRFLDDYEGCGPEDPKPHEYVKKLVHVVLVQGEQLDALAYVLKNVPRHATRIPDGDYLVWHRNQRSSIKR